MGGDISGGGFFTGGFLLKLDNTSGSWTVGGSCYIKNYDDESSINKIITKAKSGGGFDIYGCGEISATTTIDGATYSDGDEIDHTSTLDNLDYTLHVSNKDIWIIHSDDAFSSIGSDFYSKENIMVNDAGTMRPISYSYTNTNLYPYQETGPLSARNMDPNGYIMWKTTPTYF